MARIHIDPDRARGLSIWLGGRNELELTLIDLLKYPERYTEEWREIYYLLTGDRLETTAEKRFGKMLDDYMSDRL